MKQCAYLLLKPREDHRLRAGHSWVFDNEIADIKGNPVAGSRVQLFSANKEFLGSALFSPHSRIQARRFSRQDEDFTPELLRSRLARAWQWRQATMGTTESSCRLVFAEADGVPGLIVDRYVGSTPEGKPGSWLSVQMQFAGLEPFRDLLLRELAAIPGMPGPDGILDKSEAQILEQEQVPFRGGLIAGKVPPSIVINENGLVFQVDLSSGQKTGWFLDQRENRATCAAFAKGRSVLDVCCNAGGFSLCAAAAGARSVLAVDSSAEATEAVRTNAGLNGLTDRVETMQADAFDYLRQARKQGQRFDMIIVDPPAFAKNRAALKGAMRGYKDLNLQALQLLNPDGVLASFSCSYWMSRELLKQQLEAAAADAGKVLRWVRELQQAQDHPVVSCHPESAYLKGFIGQVLAW